MNLLWLWNRGLVLDRLHLEEMNDNFCTAQCHYLFNSQAHIVRSIENQWASRGVVRINAATAASLNSATQDI